jgi:hypothetical protein
MYVIDLILVMFSNVLIWRGVSEGVRVLWKVGLQKSPIILGLWAAEACMPIPEYFLSANVGTILQLDCLFEHSFACGECHIDLVSCIRRCISATAAGSWEP